MRHTPRDHPDGALVAPPAAPGRGSARPGSRPAGGDDRGPSGLRPRAQAIVLGVLATIALVFSLLQSLLVPALTSIQRDLDASDAQTTWVVTGFFLSAAVATPIIGRLGDLYGRSQMLLVSIGCLIAGSALGAVSPSIEGLIAARLLQGLSGGLVPLTFGLVRDVLPARKVPGAIGSISALLAVGAAAGIALSGPIVTGIGYRWLFWLPLIVLVPVLLLSWRTIPRSRRAAPEPVDLVGALLLTGWLVALLLGVTQGASWGWMSGGTIGLLVASVVLAVIWVAVELRMPVPLIDIRLLRQPTLLRLSLLAFAVGFGMQALFTFVPRLVQIPTQDGFGLGVGADTAGLIVLPWSVGAFVTGMLAGRVADRVGLKVPLVAGCALSIVPGLLLAAQHHRLAMIGVALGLFGVGTGLVAAAMPTIIVLFAPESQTGVAAGMNQNIRTIGGAIGAQSVGSVISSSITDGRATAEAYELAFVVVAVVAVLATLAALAVPSPRRRPTLAAA